MDGGEWGLSFLLGLASSPHCAAMCGPIVAAVGAACPGSGAAPHFAYHAGRLFTYSALGAAAGWFGQGAFWVGHVAGFERGLALAAGGLLVLTGILMAGVTRAPSPLVQLAGRTSARTWLRRAGPFLLRPSAASKLWLGLGLGMLPCGLVWAALAKAMTAGNARDGALSMLAFGAGTAVSLLAIGLLASGWSRRFSPYGTRLAAACLVVFGLVTIWRGSHPYLGEGHACHVSQSAS